MIAAFQGLAGHDAHVQRHLAVGTAVLKRAQRSIRHAVKRDGIAREMAADHLAGLDFTAPGQRVPIVGVCPDPSEVGWRFGTAGKFMVI